MSHVHHDHDPFATEEGAEFWNQWADVLETGTAAVSEALLDAVQAGDGTRLLDLACGLGHTTRAAAARGAQAVGLDLNPHMLAKARAAPGARFQVGNMLTPPSGPWDAIVSRFGAHHAEPHWLDAAVHVLAPGGHIAIAEWAPDTALFDVEPGMEGPSEDTAEDWVRRFEAAGLIRVCASQVAFTIDFGDEATFGAFIEAMDAGISRPGAPDGKQLNHAYIVSGQAPSGASS